MKTALSIVIGGVLLHATMAVAGVPTNLAVQGRLTDVNGDPLPSGPKVMTFKIYDRQTDGNLIWPTGLAEVQSVISDPNGMWSTYLGEMSPLTDAVFADSVRWLEITVDDGFNPITIMPRVRILTGAYAHRVSTVDGAAGGIIASELQVAGALSTAIQHVDSSMTPGPDESILITSGNVTITLPDAATCPGRQYVIKKVSVGDTTRVVTMPGSNDAIDNVTEISMKIQFHSITIVSDGIDRWMIVD
ncbi:MAG: hypothetical protein Kow0074_04570 [Candidatus Zixiibacteriota bacterium]